MAFWSNVTTEPKRSYRWLFYLAGEDTVIHTYMIKAVAKPSFEISEVTHQFMAHTFLYPGRITWSPVEVTVVDGVQPNAAEELDKMLSASGYVRPTSEEVSYQSMSKAAGVTALGTPRIAQVSSTGETIEEWSLKNAWISGVNYGSLDYSTDEIINITLTLKYDYAVFERGQAQLG